MSWQQVDVNLVGPWTVVTGTGRVYEFHTLTCIECVTNVPELICINDKSIEHVAAKFEECWLSRYPRSEMCAHDGGREFIGHQFQALLYSFGVVNISTNANNPQVNSVCKRMHKKVANVLKYLIHTNPPCTLSDIKSLVDSALATTIHALRANVSCATGSLPGALAFNHNMIINIPLQADLRAIHAHRQLQVDDDLIRANAR